MHPVLIAKLIFLLSIANGAPVLTRKVLGDRFSCPIDARLVFFDGRRLLGRAKTVRGALVSIALTAAAAPLLEFGVATGAIIGGTAMVGDLLSSFVKRRLNFAPSSQAIGIDQIPESLFPMVVCLGLLPLSGLDILTVVAVFCIGSISLSPVFHRMGLRDRPF